MLKLETPSLKLELSYLRGLREFTENSEKSAWVYMGESYPIDSPFNDFPSYLKELLQRETMPPAHFVCDTTYWAVQNSEVVGRISLRHSLNDFLAKVGGHIGYIVRPHFRGLGIASEMLRLILKTERATLMGPLLLTCDESNLASEKVILKNGGVLDSIVEVGEGRPRKKRFWIKVP